MREFDFGGGYKVFANILVILFITSAVNSQNSSRNSGEYAINLFVNYPASLFKIVDDLSKWSPHCEKQTYQFWSRDFSINPIQLSLLSKYAEIRKEYGWGAFEPCFMTTGTLNESISCLSQGLEINEVKVVEKVLRSFKIDFDSLWNSDHYLIDKKKKMQERMSQMNVDDLLSTIINLFNVDSPSQDFDIHLLYNPISHNSDGGANAGIFVRNGKGIPIEDDLMVMFHELTHTFGGSLTDLLFRVAKEEGIAQDFGFSVLNEAIHYTLFPGYFYEAHLGKPFDFDREAERLKDKNEYLHLTYSLAGHMYTNVKELIYNGESFDQEFIFKMVEFCTKNLREKVSTKISH